MAVEASHRRRGIGHALIDKAIAGFRLRRVERDAFTTLSGYRSGLDIDGIELRDQVWLDLDLEPPRAE